MRSATGRMLAFDVAGPLVLYYGARGIGLSTHAALLLAAAVPVIGVGIGLLAGHRPDPLGVFVAVLLIATLLVALGGGSERFVLSKDGWLTAGAGIWFAASVLGRRPMLFHGGQALLQGRFGLTGRSWDRIWEENAQFRRIWRTATAIWGGAMIADGIIRVYLAYCWPIDDVPLAGALLWPVTVGVLQVVDGIYFHVAGLWPMLRRHAPGDRNSSEPVPDAAGGD